MNVHDVLDKEAEKVSKKYKLSKEEAYLFLSERFYKNQSLVNAVEEQESPERVRRLSAYRSFLKSAVRDIYYSLRQYHQPANSPKEEHISTKERAPFEDVFFEQLISLCPDIETVIDIGGGVFPLTFPFERFPKLKHYVWVDKDEKAFKTLKGLGNPKLTLFNDKIGSVPWEKYLPDKYVSFDLALMLKLVSVIQRQERDLLPFLVKVPAKNYLVTAPKEAMTKRENVERREERVLRDFISASGGKVVGKLDVENEFGFLINCSKLDC